MLVLRSVKMGYITPIVFSTILALTIVQRAVDAKYKFIDPATPASKNPYGLMRRPFREMGGTNCWEKNSQSDCEGDCEWKGSFCGCKYAVATQRCVGGKFTHLFYPKDTNYTLANTERANNKTWTLSRTTETNLYADCVMLTNVYDITMPGTSTPITSANIANEKYYVYGSGGDDSETSSNRFYYKSFDCTDIEDYGMPVSRVYNDSACTNTNMIYESGDKINSPIADMMDTDGYYCPREDNKDAQAKCSVNSACGSLSSELTPGCDTEASCTSSLLMLGGKKTMFEDEEYGTTETCAWSNSKCGCSSNIYSQALCYNNTLFEVWWNTPNGCLNGSAAGEDLSNIIKTTMLQPDSDKDYLNCKSRSEYAVNINGTEYGKSQRGWCQGRPDFATPLTAAFASSSSDCSGTPDKLIPNDRMSQGQCRCIVTPDTSCSVSTFTCDGSGGMITKTYAANGKFDTSAMCSGTALSTSTASTKVANDWANEHAFTLDTCEMNPGGDYAVQFTCTGVPAGYSPISYAKEATSCPSGGVNAGNKDATNGNSSSPYCACVTLSSTSPASSTSPSPASSASPSPSSAATEGDSLNTSPARALRSPFALDLAVVLLLVNLFA